MYKNYIFDLYGTLVDINTDEQNDVLWDKLSEFYSFNKAHYNKKELKETYETLCKKQEEYMIKRYSFFYPEIALEKVFKKLYLLKGVKASNALVCYTSQMFRVLSTNYIRLYDGVVELLTLLKKKGKKIYLLSNAQYHFTHYELIHLDLYKYFDGVLISSIEKCKKPDPEFFNVLVTRYDLDINKSIMIGNDKSTDIAGANNINMDSLYIYSNISPLNDKETKIKATYNIYDGDFTKISSLIIK